MAENDDAATGGAVDAGSIERWALDYLGRYASSAANLRRVLLRRVRRQLSAEAAAAMAPAIDALIVRYRTNGLVDDSAYAAGQVRAGLRRGQSLRTVGAKLMAKGVAADDAMHAVEAVVDEVSGRAA